MTSRKEDNEGNNDVLPTSEELPSQPKKFLPRTSFTADSPYYTSYVETEMRQVRVLSDTLRDISGRAKTFGKCGALMAEATRRLALSCRLKPPKKAKQGQEQDDEESDGSEDDSRILRERQEAVGDEMMVVLKTLGEVLDEIADAQVQMCESLEASLSHSLEAFCGVQVHEVTTLQSESDSMTDAAEQSLARYLNGRHASEDSNSWNKLSEQVSNSFSKTFSTQTNMSGGLEGRFKNFLGTRQKDDKNKDPEQAMATTTANLRLTLEQIRLAQTSAELSRFQLLQKLVSIKKRRNFELGESALASLHGIRAYFHHCSDLVEGLTPRLTRIQATQSKSREKHAQARRPWKAREEGLVGALDQVGQAVAHASSLANLMASGELGAPASLSLKELEEETEIWHLPQLLAKASRYQREPAPGVLVEGWLYKKTSTRIALQQWNKRWFMMDKDGIYYFRTSAEMKKAGSDHLRTLERVKICDLVLCAVREMANCDLRFCFEIITPNQKPLLLQARGPTEYHMWVEGIRTSIQHQLVSGTVDANQLMKGIGKHRKGKKRGDNTGKSKTLGSVLESETSDVEMSDNDENDKESSDLSEEENQNLGRTRHPMVPDIMTANPCCADCGQDNPDWACINLGVLVCIECSGVHRSLGVHLSKVRSLTLDSLNDAEARLLLAMGNERINRILEAGLGLQQGWTKPINGSSRQDKENWIKSKYQWKGFLNDKLPDINVAEKKIHYSKVLFEAARNADVLGVAEALAYGGAVDWKNPEENGKTALHVCALSHPMNSGEIWQGIECAELMLQNGAKLGTMDDSTQGVLDSAVIGNGERKMVEFLSARLQQ
eukprot:CAMPEP_0194199544 /NCGR_PEP_ID=MMETSP0156-20130528/523_1 /TAXON_ID=33649 /ORGANISM="Thalassionema nitzschioides, Strain L26-B" /LENGTH=834 /DNA_ID=CAMNT_0038924459 /DNA_START=118 /DNA_END=2622 /DNA_ORIENTATION=+